MSENEGKKKDFSRLTTLVGSYRLRAGVEAAVFEAAYNAFIDFRTKVPGFGAHQAAHSAAVPGLYREFAWWLDPDLLDEAQTETAYAGHQEALAALAEVEIRRSRNVYQINSETEQDESAAEDDDQEDDGSILLFTAFTLTQEDQRDAFEEAYGRYADVLRSRAGFNYGDLNRYTDVPGSYVGIGYWGSQQQYDDTVADPAYRALLTLADADEEYLKHISWGRAEGDDD